ncbi:MAG TPA: sigma-70 family RNA polymerase sigma factor [Actinomycetota bacterium]|nr:sigma-70 family RNA polymerase sigma factor [Actinomycetota bacterium]
MTSRIGRPRRSITVGLPPFQHLLDAHRADVYRFLVALVGRLVAEDCFQETFLSALRAYPRLQDAANLRGWLMTIAHRKALDALRRASRRPVPVAELPDGIAPPPSLPDPSVWGAVRGLPPKQRAAVVMRYEVGLPYRDIGRALGSSEAAARQNVREAFKRLREVLT